MNFVGDSEVLVTTDCDGTARNISE